jgi:hypothetical protein
MRSHRLPNGLQKAVFNAYKALRLGDVSLAHAISDRMEPAGGSVSEKLVAAWRAGAEHVSEAPIGSLEVMLDHAGEHVGRILDAICRRYGHRAIAEAGSVGTPSEHLATLRLLAVAEVGDLCRLDPEHPESDGGREVTTAELERQLKEWEELEAVARRGVGEVRSRLEAARPRAVRSAL